MIAESSPQPASIYNAESLESIPAARSKEIQTLIDGVERYNPDNVVVLEEYLQKQCQNRTYDCLANLALFKLYQFNPQLVKEDVVQNVLLKALLAFPLPDFSLCLHLLPPHSLLVPPVDSISETIQKIVELKEILDGAEFARFWDVFNGDDFYVDLVADFADFEHVVRMGISRVIASTYTQVAVSQVEPWLDLKDDALRLWAEDRQWRIEDDSIFIPTNVDNEAKATVIREDIKLQHLSRLIKRAQTLD